MYLYTCTLYIHIHTYLCILTWHYLACHAHLPHPLHGRTQQKRNLCNGVDDDDVRVLHWKRVSYKLLCLHVLRKTNKLVQ
jgi:hypothetical protein